MEGAVLRGAVLSGENGSICVGNICQRFITVLSAIFEIASCSASPVFFTKPHFFASNSSNKSMEFRVADSDNSGDDVTMINSPLKAVSQVPVTGSPAAVPRTDVANSISRNSLVSETPLERLYNPSESNSKSENPRPRTDSNYLEEWNQAKLGLESEKKLRNRVQTDFKKKEQELNDLRRQVKKVLKKKDQELEELRLSHEAIIREKDQELDRTRQRWKQVAGELNKFMAQGQRFYQVTDQELTQNARQLRFNIRNIADQQFGGDLEDTKNFHSLLASINKYVEISSDSFEACMKDQSKRPMIVRMFLWAVLEKDVFGKSCWAGKLVSKAMSRLEQVLGKESLYLPKANLDLKMPIEPEEDNTLASGLEAKRKFQMWKANTTTLLLDSKKLNQGNGREARRKLNENNLQDICKSLGPFSKSKDRELADQIFSIFNEALNLDKLISKQVAEVVWDFDPRKNSGQFNQDLAELNQGERQTGDNGNVWLVSAPGMIKRGKSTGEDFDVETILLTRELFQEPKTTEHTGESHRTYLGAIANSAKNLLSPRY